MSYAQVVVGLPLDGPFDYEIPSLMDGVTAGSRVLVQFGARNAIAYVVGISDTPQVSGKGIKPVRRLIDRAPLLDTSLLRLTRQVSRYYCCSWGIVIESALPVSLRTSRKNPVLPVVSFPDPHPQERHPGLTVVHDPSGEQRWGVYEPKIRSSLAAGRQVLFLVPDFENIRAVSSLLTQSAGVEPVVLRRGAPNEIQAWNMIRSGEARVVVSTRSGVFAPCKDPGLIIVDEEQNETYKQEQPPHYHCRVVALMRRHIDRCELVLGSAFPSLDAYRLTRLKKTRHIILEDARVRPEIKMIDMRAEYSRVGRKAGIVTQYLQDRIAAALAEKGRVLLFINRRGFSTFAVCKSCGEVLKCPRCSGNLVYHYRRAELSCRHCTFTMSPPKVCPACTTGYMQYKGTGTERVESELSRMFPTAKIELVEAGRAIGSVPSDADIYVATSLIMKRRDIRFSMTAVLSLDDTLNRVDFRGQEKVCYLLQGLVSLTDRYLFVQTYFPGHRVFESFLKNDPALFYDKEMGERAQLHLAPFGHHVVMKVRGIKENRVREISEDIGRRVEAAVKERRVSLDLLGVYPCSPLRVRGKFNWQVLLTTRAVAAACSVIREIVRLTPRSGIIVAVDVDPL